MPNKSLLNILLMTAAGIAAGAAAAALIVSSMAGSYQAPAVISQPIARMPAVNLTKVSNAMKSAVTFYKTRTGASPLDKVFLPADEVGGGVVLTSDGWLASTSEVFAGHDELVAVFSDRTSQPVVVSKVIRDGATGLVFVKVNAQHLPVAVFGDNVSLSAGDSLYGVGLRSVQAVSVMAPRELSVQSKNDYVESTETLGRRIVLSQAVLVGAPLVNGSGETVGFGTSGSFAVPARYLTNILRSVFKDGKVVRPLSGIHYVSVDNLVVGKIPGYPETGAVVTGGGKLKALEKGSAGEAAGLMEGDVIVDVEYDRINGEATLGERLQDYAPGAKVQLSIVRNGGKLKVPLTLK